MSGKAILRAMHVVIAEGPGILVTNSPGWDFMSEMGLPRAGSNESSRQHNKSNAWFYCLYQKCYVFRSYSLTHWFMTYKTSVLNINKVLFVTLPNFPNFPHAQYFPQSCRLQLSSCITRTLSMPVSYAARGGWTKVPNWKTSASLSFHRLEHISYQEVFADFCFLFL